MLIAIWIVKIVMLIALIACVWSCFKDSDGIISTILAAVAVVTLWFNIEEFYGIGIIIICASLMFFMILLWHAPYIDIPMFALTLILTSLEISYITIANVSEVAETPYGYALQMDNGEAIFVDNVSTKIYKGDKIKYWKTSTKINDATKADITLLGPDEVQNKATTVTEIYLSTNANTRNNKTLFLADGGVVKIYEENDNLYVSYKQNKTQGGTYNFGDAPHKEWNKAIKGDSVVYMVDRKTGDFRYYTVVFPEDYTIEKTVAQVKKYDGGEGKLNGEFQLQSHFLSSSSGSGHVHGSNQFGNDFYIDITFTDGTTSSITASGNSMWRQISEGNIVIEKRIDGEIMLIPTNRMNEN